MSNQVTKILLAAVTGLAAGFVLGILFAPDKGSETQKKIRKTFDDLADRIGETMEEQFGHFRETAPGKSDQDDAGQSTQ
jgi:gas vesicle protein